MRILLLYIGLLILSEGLIAQINLKDNELFCEQYSKIIDFISVDTSAKKEFPFKKLNFQIDNNIGYGIGAPFMTKYYIFQTLGIETNKLDSKDSTITEIWKNLEKEEYENARIKEQSICLSALKNYNLHYNVYLSFARKNDRVVFVNSRRIYNYQRHSNGIFYLFFFDSENNIIKTYSDIWIE